MIPNSIRRRSLPSRSVQRECSGELVPANARFCFRPASTDPEAFGRVAPEAAAMARPVIATDHGGARETVLAGISGLLVPAADSGALATAVSDLLARSPERLAAMGEAGRSHVRANFS